MLAALFYLPSSAYLLLLGSAAFTLRSLCIALGRRWCEHDYPRWGYAGIHRRFIRAFYYASWETLLATRGGPEWTQLSRMRQRPGPGQPPGKGAIWARCTGRMWAPMMGS